MVRTTPEPEVDVTVDLVRTLLADQHPDLAHEELSIVANGWDNVILRLGDRLAVRVPRRAIAAELVEHEQRWLPELAEGLPLRVPVPIRVGRPGRGFPWSWSVIPWFGGAVGADVTLADPETDAERLGRFLRALHRPAPSDAPANPFRGGPLADLDERFAGNLEELSDRVDVGAVAAAWSACREAPEWVGAPVWIHGDLHSANVLVVDGRLDAVIDFGDLTAGDPATDLAIGWMLFDDAGREVLRRTRRVDDATWTRASGWALHFALVYLMHSADDPRLEAMAVGLLDRLGL